MRELGSDSPVARAQARAIVANALANRDATNRHQLL